MRTKLPCVTRGDVVEALKKRATELKSTYGLRRLALFGSASRDALGPGSDVDILVEFDAPASFDGYMDLKLHLESILGTRVDLVTPGALRARLREAIARECLDVA